MKQLLLLLASISPSFAQLPNIDYAGAFFATQVVTNNSGPIRKVSTLPATCTAVGGASSSNAVLYQGRLYQCAATNTWAFAVGQTAALTSGRVPIVTTNGVLTDLAGFTHNGNAVLGLSSTGNTPAQLNLVALDGGGSASAVVGFQTAGGSGQFTYTNTGAMIFRNSGTGKITYFDFSSGGAIFRNSSFSQIWSIDEGGAVILRGTPQTLTGPGAVNLTTHSTLIVTTGADALTLADGAEGQRKFIRMKTDGGDGTLTVTNLQGGTTITFNDAGDFVELFYQDAKWHIIVNSGCAVA